MIERRTGAEIVVTVNEAAFAAGLTVKSVNQAIDRKHIRTRALRRALDRAKGAARGVAVSDLVYLRVQRMLAPEFRAKLYQSLRGKEMAEIPRRIEMNTVVLDLEQPIREITARLELLARIDERIEANPEIRGGEPVFRGTRTPVYAIARKLELGASTDEIHEDSPQLQEGDFELAARFAELHPRRGRPRNDWTSALERIDRPRDPVPDR